MKKIMTGARCTIRIGEHAFLPCASFSYSAPKVSLLSRAAKQLRMALIWIAWNVPLGPLTPYIIGWELGAKARRMPKKEI